MPAKEQMHCRQRPVHSKESKTVTVLNPSVDDVMQWVYCTVRGDEWDSQPACWITDYILGVQCFIAVASIMYYSNEDRHDAFWYLLYLISMGCTATIGGLLHHVAFKAMTRFVDAVQTHRRRVFGLYMTQATVDRCIRWMWRFVLGLTTLANFALVANSASRYLDNSVSNVTISVAGVAYTGVALAAFVTMRTSVMLLGFIPPLCFGSVATLIALERGWFSELLVLLFILAGGLIQAIQVSPSHKHFNHNALAHVLLSASVTAMTYHFHWVATS